MTISRLLVATALSVPLAVAGWFGWCWIDTPTPPELALERMDSAVASAIREAVAQVEREPRSGPAWGKLGKVVAVNGYTEPALMCFAHAERFDPHDARWPYLQGQLLLTSEPQRALPCLERALKRATSDADRSAIHFRLALTLLEHGQHAQAEEHVLALSALEPQSPRVRYGLALLAAARNDARQARTHFDSLLASPFARKQAHSRLATLALVDGDAALAEAFQKGAVRLPADLPWPDPFLEAMNTYAVGRQNRVLEAEQLESQGRQQEAVALYRKLAAETPDARSFLALGLALGKLEAHDEAKEMLRTVIRLDGTNLQAHHFLGAILLYQGESELGEPRSRSRADELFREAITAEDQALAINPQHALAHQVRGRALGYLRRTEESLAALREAVACRPEFAESHRFLGEALAEAGHLPEALVHLEAAVRLAPNPDPRARAALEKWRAKSK